jgi:hypothetical protein
MLETSRRVLTDSSTAMVSVLQVLIRQNVIHLVSDTV